MPHPLSTWGPALDRHGSPQIARLPDLPAEDEHATPPDATPARPLHSLSDYGQALLKANTQTSSPTTPLRSLQSLQPPLPSPAAQGSPLPKLTRSAIPAPTLTPRPPEEENVEGSKAEDAQHAPKANDLVPPREPPAAPPLFVNGYFDAEPSPPDIPDPQSIPTYAIPTELPMLDQMLKSDIDHAGRVGLSPGGALEIIGPTASCKTMLGIQSIANLRAAAVVAQHRERHLWAEETHGEASDTEEDLDRVIVVDTEGSIAPDMVRAALLNSIQALLGPDKSLDPRDLLKDALAGIHLIRITSLPELIATLRALTSPGPPYLLPPPHTLSAILIDSASFHLRMPSERSDNRPRRYAIALLAELHPRITALNPRVRVIATNQMSLKMFTPSGELVNYKVPGSIARMVPQLDAIPTFGSGDGTTTNARWNGTSRPGSQPLFGDDAAGQDKGMGLLGARAHRVVLFRAVQRRGAQRFAQVIYRPAGSPAPEASSSATHIPPGTAPQDAGPQQRTTKAFKPAARSGPREPFGGKQQASLQSAQLEWIPFKVVSSDIAGGAILTPD